MRPINFVVDVQVDAPATTKQADALYNNHPRWRLNLDGSRDQAGKRNQHQPMRSAGSG